MSKKKSFSGSTMTLKDFHGGSIPSDLPLPSAPGVIVRPSDRSSFDRQISAPSWGSSSINRSDHRSRPGSSGPTRTFDEKASFLSVPNIGRNFDEDERKPFDGGVPRRPVSEDALRPLPSARLDPKPLPSRQISTATVVQSPPAAVKPAAGPNAWGSRREAPEPVPPPPASSWSASSVVSKFAQASAVEKVSSGRWQSKPTTPIYHHPPDVEVIRYAETERETDIRFSANQMDSRGEFDALRGKYSSTNQMDYRNEFDVPRGKYNGGNQMEIRSEFDAPRGKYNGGNQINRSEFDAPGGKYNDGNQMESRSEFDAPQGTYHSVNLTDNRRDTDAPRAEKYSERGGPPMYLEVKEWSSAFYSDGIRPASTEGKLGSGSQSQLVAEVSERPKLKLLPRTKPMDPAETQLVDHKQGYQPPHADLGHIEVVNESVVNLNPPKPGSAGGDGVNRAVERPRLNLKPRSQPLEQSEDSMERERKTLFGGARPRELVLKERGVDDVVINNLEYNQLGNNRAKHDLPKPDTKPDSPLSTTRNSDRHENFLPSDQRSGREFDRKDHRPETEKMDMQRSSRRNENRRNSKEIEKPQERRPEPESWRKPVEPPIPPVSEAPAPRFGRAASALELAQAFSRTMSDAKSTDKFGSQRSLPGRNQLPFSRLTDTREFYSGPTTRQINGY